MPNRAQALVWESERDPAVRTELIDAALALADEAGLSAVSIRRIGERIGRRPMSLYSHIPSKDALLALMFDRVSDQLLVPQPLPTDGHDLLRQIASRAYETYLAHPWMLHAYGARPEPGPNQLRRAEQYATAVEALGVPGDQAWAAVSLVHEWVMGHAIHTITLREDKALRRVLRDPDSTSHPAATRALAAAKNQDSRAALEQGLNTILLGIEAHQDCPPGRGAGTAQDPKVSATPPHRSSQASSPIATDGQHSGSPPR